MELTKMCRVCLLPQDEIDLLDWNNTIYPLEFPMTYKECFCKCTQINLSLKNDTSDTENSQTQYLCYGCAQSLKNAHDFIEKAKRADNELRSRQIDNNFEWVAVSAKEVDIDMKDVVLDGKQKNCFDKINEKNINHSLDEQDNNLSNNIDQEYFTTANMIEESYENYLNENTKSEKEELIYYPGIASSEVESGHDGSSTKSMKKLQPRRNDSKAGSRKSKKDEMNMDEMVPCDVCQKVMTRKGLVKHQYRHKPKTFLCHSCPKAFLDAYSLKTHEVIHEESRERYPCDQCGQSFLSRSTYKTHARTHDLNRKPMYQCAQCEKSFSHKQNLAAHQQRHDPSEPKIKCNFCDKRYYRQIDLKIHLETHSGETPFRCSVCDKSYINKRVLNKHMQQHEGFFRYTCTTCGEQFSRYERYFIHRQQHTGPAYKCSICDKGFYNCYRCKRHIRRAHKVTEESELARLALKINETREHRGRIVEVLKNADDQ